MGNKNIIDMTIRANMELDNISSEVLQVQKVLNNMKLGPELKRSFDQAFEDIFKEMGKVEKSLSSGFKTKSDATGFKKASANLLSSLNKVETKLFKLYNLSDKELLKLDPTLGKDIEAIEKKFANMSEDFPDNIKKGLKDVGKHVNDLVKDTQKKAGKEILDKVNKKDYSGALKQAEQKLRQQQWAYDNNIHARDPKGNTVIQLNAYKQIVDVLREAVTYQDQFNNKAELLETEKAQRFKQTFDNIKTALEGAQGAISNVSGNFNGISSEIQEANTATINFNNEMESIKGKIQYFFSLANSVAVVRKILRDTIQTTKELDAAMTETAVVTDFSVADMWKDLPRYTKEAKELGVTIKGVYETMTLYYQQGLKTQEVFEVGSETLKMAKIAGLEYAEATDYMTAALRGFNMEVNEINAQKVNDVYSELAAITAADTQEIATAMTKTASIASSANMEFETTAAFLSQIVETTRESAETAGTAMKTVIARFTELKKDPAEIGEVDGEIVDANKIETALRTINVALRDTNGQFRDLDDVFLDISSKWGDLDTNTQRYIATMAAGSRQQSRFIAMMSDYDRTMELVNAAQNSEGASQKQFDKTLESLASKLDQLKTAWQQFTMGFADDTLIKGAIDTLTFLINRLNKLTEGLPGITKSLANFLILGAGFKVGGKLTRAVTASFGADLLALAKDGEKAGQRTGIKFRDALKKEFDSTKKLFKKETYISYDDSFSKTKESILDKKDEELLSKKIGVKSEIFKEEKGNNKDEKKLETLKEELSKLQKEEEAFAKSQELLSNASQSQQSAFLALLDEQVPANKAIIALQEESADLDYRDLAIQSLKNISQKAENELTEEEIKAKEDAIKAKMAEQSADKMGLLTKAKYLFLLVFGSEEQKKDAKTKLVNAGATWVLKIAEDALNGSLATTVLLIGAIVIAAAALGFAIYKIAKNLKENSLEYKMEKAAEATEKAKEAANAARQSYEDLKDSIQGIGEAEKEIDKLTHGTLEWQQAILGVNQDVMELINKFPNLRSELLNELQVDGNGKLTLSSKGYELIEQEGLNRYQNLYSRQLVSMAEEAKLKKEAALADIKSGNNFVLTDYIEKTPEKSESRWKDFAYRAGSFFKADQSLRILTNPFLASAMMGSDLLFKTDFLKKVSTRLVDSGVNTIAGYNVKEDQANKEAVYAKFQENPEMFTSDSVDLRFFAKELGLDYNSLLEFIPEMQKLQAEELEYEKTARTQAQQIIYTNTSEEFKEKDNSEELVSVFGDFYVERQEEEITQEIDNIDEKDLRSYAEELGINNFVNQKDELKNLQKLYEDLTGLTEEEIEDMFGDNKDELKKAIAAIKVSKNWGKKVEGFADELDNFAEQIDNTDQEKFIRELFGGADGVGFTKNNWNLDELGNWDPNSEVNDAIKQFWTESDALKDQFKTEEEFNTWAKEQAKQAYDTYTTATKELIAHGFDAETMFSDNMEIGVIQGLSKNYIEIFKESGKEGAIELSNQINEIFTSLEAKDPEKAKQFAAALNAIDWNSKEEVEGFSDNLEDLGITIDPTVGDVEDLEDQIVELGKASSEASLEDLIEDVQELGRISYGITSGEVEGRSFSEEDVNLLTSTGALQHSDFSYNVETGDYTYLGDSTDRIVKAIEEQTDDLLGISEYENKIASGEAVKTLVEDQKINPTTYAEKAEFLEAYDRLLIGKKADRPFSRDFIENAKKNSNNVIVQKSIDEAYDQIIQDYKNLEANHVAYSDILKETGAIELQLKYNSSDLAKMAGDLRSELTKRTFTAEDLSTLANYESAIINKAVSVGTPSNQIDEYIREKDKIGELAVAGADEKTINKQIEKVNKLERELGTNNDYIKTNERLETNINKTIELLDEYEDLKDEKSKINQVQQMVDNFGVDYKVNSKNYKAIYDYVLGTARGENEGYKRLTGLKTKSQGIEVTSKGTFTGLKKGGKYNANSEVTEMINSMAEKGTLVTESVDLSKRSSYNNTLQRIVDANGNITYKTITASTKLTKDSVIVRPKTSNELLTAATKGGGGEDYWPSEDDKDKDKKDKKDKWENPYDGFYNINEEINALIKKRNDLEREHEKLIKNENATADDYYNSYTKRLKNYKDEVKLQKQLLDLRKQEQKKLQEKYSDLKEYAWIENGQVKINLKKIDAVTDEDLGQDIEDYISALEENLEGIESAEETIDKTEVSINELGDTWRETTANFERKIYDALVESREKDIEEMQTLADTLNEAASDLVSAIQDEIDERRRERENKETEEDIIDKEKRLAYLQQDTSGAYEQEILDLQKELDEQKEDYTDTLIDQKISDLQDQNEDAAKQRERQIKIAQTQLQYDIENGKISKQALLILKEAGTSKGQKSLWKLLKGTDEYKNLGSTETEVWTEENKKSLLEALSYLKAEDKKVLEETLAELKKNPSKRKLEMTKRQERDKDEDEEDEEEEKTIDYKDINYKKDKEQYKPSKSQIINGVEYKYIKAKDKWYKKSDLKPVSGKSELYTIKSQANGLDAIMLPKGTISKAIVLGSSSSEELSKKQARGQISEEIINGETYYMYDGKYYKKSSLKTKQKDGKYITYFPKKTKNYIRYKTGGLADYTGPAWLDGTKSKPEIVLNQQDTQNFLALKDVLSDFMSNTDNLVSNNQSGDTNYEISINVEKLSNDYDVEQVASKIKQMVSADARYRNSNFISRLR